MNIIVATDKNGGTAALTTDSPLSHYGAPVLRIEADDIDGDFGPRDIIDGRPAAYAVAGWAIQAERTPEEIEAAKKFLSQWPEGPQYHSVGQYSIPTDHDPSLCPICGEKMGYSEIEQAYRCSHCNEIFEA